MTFYKQLVSQIVTLDAYVRICIVCFCWTLPVLFWKSCLPWCCCLFYFPFFGPSSNLSWCVSAVSCFPAYLNPPHCIPFQIIVVSLLSCYILCLACDCFVLFCWVVAWSLLVWLAQPASHFVYDPLLPIGLRILLFGLCSSDLASSFCTLTVNYTEEFKKPSSFLMKTRE